MVIIAGHLVVHPEQRESYLDDCTRVVELARQAPGCLDLTLSADLLDPGRIDVLERRDSQAAVDAFRGSGPSDQQGADMVAASVAEYDVAGVRRLTSAAAPPGRSVCSTTSRNDVGVVSVADRLPATSAPPSAAPPATGRLRQKGSPSGLVPADVDGGSTYR